MLVADHFQDLDVVPVVPFQTGFICFLVYKWKSKRVDENQTTAEGA